MYVATDSSRRTLRSTSPSTAGAASPRPRAFSCTGSPDWSTGCCGTWAAARPDRACPARGRLPGPGRGHGHRTDRRRLPGGTHHPPTPARRVGPAPEAASTAPAGHDPVGRCLRGVLGPGAPLPGPRGTTPRTSRWTATAPGATGPHRGLPGRGVRRGRSGRRAGRSPRPRGAHRPVEGPEAISTRSGRRDRAGGLGAVLDPCRLAAAMVRILLRAVGRGCPTGAGRDVPSRGFS